MAKKKTKNRIPKDVAETVIERAEGRCEFMIPGPCVFQAQHLHHRKISGREHRVENLANICHACHDFVHANPAWSYERGYLVKMNYDPAQVPAQYRGMPSLLTEDGGVEWVRTDDRE